MKEIKTLENLREFNELRHKLQADQSLVRADLSRLKVNIKRVSGQSDKSTLPTLLTQMVDADVLRASLKVQISELKSMWKSPSYKVNYLAVIHLAEGEPLFSNIRTTLFNAVKWRNKILKREIAAGNIEERSPHNTPLVCGKLQVSIERKNAPPSEGYAVRPVKPIEYKEYIF